LPLKQLRLTAE